MVPAPVDAEARRIAGREVKDLVHDLASVGLGRVQTGHVRSGQGEAQGQLGQVLEPGQLPGDLDVGAPAAGQGRPVADVAVPGALAPAMPGLEVQLPIMGWYRGDTMVHKVLDRGRLGALTRPVSQRPPGSASTVGPGGNTMPSNPAQVMPCVTRTQPEPSRSKRCSMWRRARGGRTGARSRNASSGRGPNRRAVRPGTGGPWLGRSRSRRWRCRALRASRAMPQAIRAVVQGGSVRARRRQWARFTICSFRAAGGATVARARRTAQDKGGFEPVSRAGNVAHRRGFGYIWATPRGLVPGPGAMEGAWPRHAGK